MNHRFYLKRVPGEPLFKILAIHSDELPLSIHPGDKLTLEDVGQIVKSGHDVHVAPAYPLSVPDKGPRKWFLAEDVRRKHS